MWRAVVVAREAVIDTHDAPGADAVVEEAHLIRVRVGVKVRVRGRGSVGIRLVVEEAHRVLAARADLAREEEVLDGACACAYHSHSRYAGHNDGRRTAGDQPRKRATVL